MRDTYSDDIIIIVININFMRFFVIDSFGLVVFAFDQCVQKCESAFCWSFGDMFGAGGDKFLDTCVIHHLVTAV